MPLVAEVKVLAMRTIEATEFSGQNCDSSLSGRFPFSSLYEFCSVACCVLNVSTE